MSARKVLSVMGLCVLLAVASGIAYADEQGVLTNDSSGYSPSVDPSSSSAQPDASQIREPMDTGAVPTMESMPERSCCGGQSEETEQIGTNVYRHGLDDIP